MTDKYQGKYRIASARAPWWDYGRQASYFITICTKYRKHFFGEIVRGNVILSDIGRTVEIEWRKTAKLRSDMNLHLASIVRGFKSAVTTTARKSGNNVFGWQPRFHDHIIRDDSAYQRIARYIANNPARWQNDTFYTLT